jgi:hypothetical protein
MGILGISAHKTTTYGMQQFTPMNGGWIADPVSTASASAVAQGSSIPDSVKDMFESGAGYQMRHYYQIAARRWKKRLIEWEMKLVSAKESVINSKSLSQQFPSLQHKQVKIVQKDYNYNINGAKYFYDMHQLGLHDFDNTSIVLSAISPASMLGSNLSRSWVIGSDSSNNNRPAILLHPEDTAPSNVTVAKVVAYTPTPSMGVVYWETSDTPKESKYLYTSNLYIDVTEEINNLTIGSDWVALSQVSDWEDDGFYIDRAGIHTEDNSKIEAQQEELQLRTNIEYKVVIEVRREDLKLYYRFRVDKYEYTKENYIWATETAESETGVKKYFLDLNKINESIKKVWKSSDPATKYTFKPYPYLPTKEVGHEIMNWDESAKYTNAVNVINGLGEDAEQSEPDIGKGISKEQRKEVFSKKRNKKPVKPVLEAETGVGAIFGATRRNEERKKEYEKKLKYSEHSSRAKRVVAGTRKYARKAKPKGNLINKGDKKYLELLASRLGQDYDFVSASVNQMPDKDNVMNAAMCVSVPFGSNFDEADHYWYKYFDKMYDTLGDGGYAQFANAVNSSPVGALEARNLPYYRMDFNTPNGQYGGMMSFAYIRKFRIKGILRKTKRGRVKYEIKRGILTDILNGTSGEIRDVLLNPTLDQVGDKYHTSKNGKEYNIGEGTALRSLGRYSKVKPTYTKSFESITENLLDPAYDAYVKKLSAEIHTSYSTYIEKINKPSNPVVDPAVSVWDSGRKGAISLFKRSGYKGEEGFALDWNNNVSRLIFERFGYTYMCKKVNEEEIDVIAVAGLVFGTYNSYDNSYSEDHIHGVNIVCRANTQLELHINRNRAHYIDGISWNKVNVYLEYNSGSGKYRYSQQIRQFCVMPMDYKVYSRLGSASQARLAPRVVQQQIWQKQRVRQLRGWVSTALQVVGFIISGLLSGFGLSSVGSLLQGSIQAFIQVAKQIVTSLLVSFAVGQVLKLLIKVLGIKGFIALIIAIAATMIVSAYGGYSNNSALPLAAETATRTVAQSAPVIASEAARQSIIQSIVNSIKSSIQSILQQTLKEAISNSIRLADMAVKTVAAERAAQMQAAQNDFIENQRQYQEAMKYLDDLQESNEKSIQPYDVKVVLNSLRSKLQLEVPDMWVESRLITDSAQASESYLSIFLESKLNLDPLVYEAVRSLDFSLQPPKMV